MHVNGQRDLGPVDAPNGVKPIRCRRVFKVKYNTNGSVNHYKARLVVQSYVQKHDMDYDETFTSCWPMVVVWTEKR